ncbi:MAG: hypothetical protein ACI8YQ_002779 [Polaribacter sp.]|jgi:hypothetical protein
MKKLGIFTLLCLLIFSSCRKDTNDEMVDPSTPDPTIENYEPKVETITGDITGYIIDENGEPVIAANVTLDGNNTTTDDYGHFFFKGESLNKLGTLVKVQKEGYFKGSRRFFPKASQDNRVKIQLLTKSFDESFNTADGGTITMGNGASVDFSANSIRTEAGAAYSGTVKVATKWMDPSLTATLDQMPGNLQGLNADVEEMTLATYGMIAVELEGENGEALNIANNMTATISMPVPADMLNAAPSEIPLWSYNEEYGLWVEESTATLQNGAYVGEVSHFSFWNCDLPFEYVNLDLTLIDDNGNPLSNYLVTLTAGAGTNAPMTSGSGWTDANGSVSGAIPANEELTLEVIGICGEVLFTTTVGPYSADATETITTSGSTVNATTITGTLVDCDGNDITNGLIIATFNGQTVYHYISANFSYTFTTCGGAGDVTVTGIDLDALEQGAEVTAPANATTDLGNLSTCGSPVLSGLTVSVDGVEKIYLAVNVNTNASFNYISVDFGGMSNDYIYFAFEGGDVGDYSNNNFLEGIFDSTMGWGFFNNTGFDTFIVTQYDTQLMGTASGMFTNSVTGLESLVELDFNIAL